MKALFSLFIVALMGFSTIGTSNKSGISKLPFKEKFEGVTGSTEVYCGSTVTYYRSSSCPCNNQPWQDPTNSWVTVVGGGGMASYITVEVNSCAYDPNKCHGDPVGSYGIEIGDCGCDLACTVLYY